MTHYPQTRAEHRFFRGDLALPPRIIMLDGSGALSFDVISWLAEQNVPLFRIDWRGEVVSVIGGQGFVVEPERVQWQIEAAAEGYDPRRGVMHHDRDDTQALVYDLIEPRRPIADAKVLNFALKTPFTGADFVIREDGVRRVAPQLARRICSL